MQLASYWMIDAILRKYSGDVAGVSSIECILRDGSRSARCRVRQLLSEICQLFLSL